MGKTQSVILLVDKNAWHHSSAATALSSCVPDVQLFAKVCVETENIISKVKREKQKIQSQAIKKS